MSFMAKSTLQPFHNSAPNPTCSPFTPYRSEQSQRPPQYRGATSSTVNSSRHTPTDEPPPPYSSLRLFPCKKGSSGRWNPFSRKSSSIPKGVNPHGLQAEMLQPEDRAWA
ncbi:hypothetical protein B0H12DRAFT_1229457 [Mycena haematopus]|nr:hypothetical protein B0H12DRAFT_1229457 [Mycena haematopus]